MVTTCHLNGPAPAHRAGERGASLGELALVLVLIGGIFQAAAPLIEWATTSYTLRRMVQDADALYAALGEYAEDQYAARVTGGSQADGTTINVPVSTLAAGQYLPAGSFASTATPMGSTWRLRLRRDGTELRYLVTTTQRLAASLRQATRVAARLKADQAGPVGMPSVQHYAAWNTTLAAFGINAAAAAQAPTVAAYGSVGAKEAALSDYLYRVAVPGRPEANRIEADTTVASGADITLEGQGPGGAGRSVRSAVMYSAVAADNTVMPFDPTTFCPAGQAAIPYISLSWVGQPLSDIRPYMDTSVATSWRVRIRAADFTGTCIGTGCGGASPALASSRVRVLVHVRCL